MKTQSAEKFKSSSKLSTESSKTQSALADKNVDELDDDQAIEEFIKKHLDNDNKIEAKKETKNELNEDSNSDEDDNSNSFGTLTPRQSLL